MGSPPLARGIRKYCREMGYTHGITPACAGNTQNLTLGEAIDRDHPRLRGEYSEMSLHHYGKPGSPPLARGILL